MKQFSYRLLFVIGCSISMFVACTSQTKNAEVVQEKEEPSQLEKEHTLLRVSYADSVNQGLLEDTFKGSARREARGMLGSLEVVINYGSPGKRGRVLWNGLVSYDQVWVSGSHWATAVSFSEDVVISGVDVPAGMYGFFTIPGREEWTLILNKEYDMHLAEEYSEENDIVRTVVPTEEMDDITQRLTYRIEQLSDSSGAIVLLWDEVKVAMTFEVR